MKKIRITNKKHTLYGRIYDVEEESDIHYTIKLHNGSHAKIFKDDCELIGGDIMNKEVKEIHIPNLKQLIKEHKDNDAIFETLDYCLQSLTQPLPKDIEEDVLIHLNLLHERATKYSEMTDTVNFNIINDLSRDVILKSLQHSVPTAEVYLITQNGKYLKTYNEFGYIEETVNSNEAELFTCGDSDVDLYKDELGWAWKDKPLLALNEDDFEIYNIIMNEVK